jgi:hypothetical protein
MQKSGLFYLMLLRGFLVTCNNDVSKEIIEQKIPFFYM